MQTKQLENNFLRLVSTYKKTNPNLNLNFLSKLLYSFISYLREYLEKLEDRKTEWDNTIVKIEYTLETNDDGSENICLKQNSLEQNIMEKVYLEVFKEITGNALIIKEKNGSTFQTPKEFLKNIAELSQQEQANKIYKLFNPESFIIKPFNDKPAIIISFSPLVYDKDNNQKYYQVLLKIDVGNFKPYMWKEEVSKNFWHRILEYVSQINSENTFSFINEIEPPLLHLKKLDIKTIDKSKQLIKASLHTELQKFGRKPKKNGSILDLLEQPLEDELQKDISDYKIEVIGLDNTKPQNQALFAIQKLFHETGYKGNSEGKTLNKDDNSFKFMGYLPAIKFTPAQYLEAYGVTKKERARGKWEYLSNERSEALKALRELSQKKYLFYYEKKYWKDAKELFDLITTVRSLFNLTEKYEAIDHNEVKIIENNQVSLKTEEKLSYIVLEPCPLLVDQIETYFVLKPANFYQEIKLLFGKTSKQVPLFIDFLIAEITKREISSKGKDIDWIIELNYETLAYKIRMEKMIEANKVKRIKQELVKCYKIAKQLGYLLDYETIMGSTIELERLVLNPDKFRRVKEINEEIKLINSNSNF
ncbi:MAG: hypothetical protein H7263_16840 [Candidatus Sericytochromatia bacterium]|nr:hypothetical protein [Candidatus Sericytochromatia bacterium]